MEQKEQRTVSDTIESISQSNTEQQSMNPDDALLASLGYKQEFRREFSPLEVFGVAFSIIGVLPSIAFVSIPRSYLRNHS